MHPSITRIFAIAAAAGALSAAVPRDALAAPAPCTLAITHVSVLPMDRERVLRDQTVMVAGDRIVAISRNPRGVAGCGRRIDGRGRYLVPGLNDLHAHVESTMFAQAFGAPAKPIDYPAALSLYLANGVTGVRVMSGAPDIVAFRDRQRAISLQSPRLVVASPMLSGEPPVIPEPITRVVATPEQARAAVAEFAAAGYDFIKVRDNLEPVVLKAIIEAAASLGLYVDGHLSRGQHLSLADVLAMGQKGIAHIDNLTLAMDDPDVDGPAYARLLVACGCFVSTTLSVETNAVAQINDYDAVAAQPEIRFMDTSVRRLFWTKANNPYLTQNADPAFFTSLNVQNQALLKIFADAGVHLVAGTDALNPMIIPGVSLHDELALLVQAGLSPYQALRAATANASDYVPGFSDVGVLAVGRRANAVLVDADPLKGLATLRHPSAVMINGVWLTREDLGRRLDAAAAQFAEH